ncbi:MAG: hypothetical protein BAJATHORv1_60045 [Candidatus Thorarchaeota archaeon]|nr:MAG: hypothetical protein BAJATHORv1_60045 [Candidatus Thorarchaeota archaeon]
MNFGLSNSYRWQTCTFINYVKVNIREMSLRSCTKIALMVSFLIIILGIPVAAQGHELLPNQIDYSNELIGNNENYYYSNLEPGTWTVAVSCNTICDMEVRIDVSLNETFTNIIATTEGSIDTGVSAEITLVAAETVYIKITKIGGTPGEYGIAVYDEMHMLLPMITPWIILIGGAVVVIVAIFIRRRMIKPKARGAEYPPKSPPEI